MGIVNNFNEKKVLYVAPMPLKGRFLGGIAFISSKMKENLSEFQKRGYDLVFFNSEVSERKLGKEGQINLENFTNAYRFVKCLKREVELNNYHLINYQTSRQLAIFKDLILLSFFLRKFSNNIILNIHYADIKEILPKNPILFRLCMYMIKKNIGFVTFLSKKTRDEFVSLGLRENKTSVLYNFCPEKFNEEIVLQKINNVINKKHINLLFMGSIDKRKGILDLLSALIKLEDPRLVLHICGTLTDQTIKSEYETKIKILGEQVVNHGYISGHEKSNILQNTDILVLPSYGEGMPVVILEAMAAGCSIISTYVGAIPELITPPDNGVLIRPGDSEGIAREIEQFANNREKLKETMMLNYKKSREFGVDNYITTLCSLYREVTNETSR